MLSIEQLTELLGWASIINIGVLLVSTLAVLFMREAMTGIHRKLFGLEKPDLARMYFQYLAQYKIATLVFCVVPYVALKIIG